MKTWLALLSALLLTTSLSALADTGTDRGNPGDDYAFAFMNVGYDLAEQLAKDPLPGVNAAALANAVQTVPVKSEPRLFLRGQEVAGINHPEASPPYIEMSRTRWDAMKDQPGLRVKIVLHEYLGIMGVDDARGQVTNLLDRAHVCDRAPAVRRIIERELKKSCYRVIPDDLQYVMSAWLAGSGLTALRASDFAGLGGLENMYLQNLELSSVDANFFQLFPRMDSLVTGAAITSLADCSLVSAMPLIRHVTIGYGTYANRAFLPLERIARSCFSGWQKLKTLILDIDGVSTAMAGAFEGLPAGTNLTLVGTNLDRWNTEELRGLDLRSVSLHSLDRPLSDELAHRLQKLFPLLQCWKASARGMDEVVRPVVTCQ